MYTWSQYFSHFVQSSVAEGKMRAAAVAVYKFCHCDHTPNSFLHLSSDHVDKETENEFWVLGSMNSVYTCHDNVAADLLF